MRTQGLFEIIVVILRAASLTFQSLVIGGVVFQRWIANDSPTVEGARRRGIGLLRFSAVALAIAQVFYLGINMLVLREVLRLPWTDIVTANFSYVGLVVITASLAMAVSLRRGSCSRTIPAILATIILACGVLASHAASRIQDRWWLVIVTATHHCAAALWIGGLPQLWVSLRECDSAEYSRVTERFPRLALISVLALFGSGLAMALRYVDSTEAIYGTSYGIMLIIKVGFFAVLLAIGACNRMLLRSPEAAPAIFSLRRLLEAEIGIGITAILAAASLTSQPPAADLKIGRLTSQEIYARLRPSWPRLVSPRMSEVSASTLEAEKQAQRTGLPPPPQVNTLGDIAWSEYNHHWAGIFVLLAGLAGLAQARGSCRIRYWPLMLVGLAVFIILRADPEGWPLGPDSFWESIQNGEVLQHKAFAVLLLLLAVFELRVQLGKSRPYAAYVFPAVCALGGAFLLTHSHGLNNVKEQVLAEMSHAPIAVAAVLAGWSRWLQIRLPAEKTGLASRIWPACFVVIGIVLLNYREA